ncbi:MAG: SPOR domain-containing protein [Pseudomonadales bacterium]|jgi:cell division protein FtsN|nr:SPOR domain-containing protein [Pseudomonadales bacterium]MCP5322209.1 SPOR domain-containing protein [Pseudomonadales bacterium]MCP5337095.1 SPOR domain-containing protein [Pseudomonadales bacterium]
MAHDFAKQRAARDGRSGKSTSAPWTWLLSGVVIGGAFSFLAYLAMLKPPAPAPAPAPGQAGTGAPTAAASQPAQAPEEPEEAKPAQKSEPATSARPQFDFYDILRDNHAAPTTTRGAATDARSTDGAQPVEVPEPAPAPAATAPVTPTAPPARTPATPPPAPVETAPASAQPAALVLQAGAFSRAADADRRRGELLLLGYDAKVETVRLPDGQTRYRVQVGPFTDPQGLAHARRALRDVGIETL